MLKKIIVIVFLISFFIDKAEAVPVGSGVEYIPPERNLGIGEINPEAKLHINGSILIKGGNPGTGKILSSDRNGLASWQEPSELLMDVENANTANLANAVINNSISSPSILNGSITVEDLNGSVFDSFVPSSLKAPDGDPNPALQVNDSGYVGINTDTPRTFLHVAADKLPVVLFERKTTATNGRASGTFVKTTTSGDMSKGMATGVVFLLEDNAGVEKIMGGVYGKREDTDNDGSIVFTTYNNGSENVSLSIKPEGNIETKGVVHIDKSHFNVLNFYNTVQDTPEKGVKIYTNIPFTHSSSMPILNIKGYTYAGSKTIDLQLSWYLYNASDTANPNVINRAASSAGGHTPEIKIGRENGKVVLFINSKLYFQRFTVTAYDIWNTTQNRNSWYEGWTAADEDFSSGVDQIAMFEYKNQMGDLTLTGSLSTKSLTLNGVNLTEINNVANADTANEAAFASDSATSTLADSAKRVVSPDNLTTVFSTDNQGHAGIGVGPREYYKLFVLNSTADGVISKHTMFTERRTVTSTDVTSYDKSIFAVIVDYDIPAGVTDSGYKIGLDASSFANNPEGFAGTLDQAMGVWARTGIYRAQAGSQLNKAIAVRADILNAEPNTAIGEAYGMYIRPFGANGTITDGYGIYIGDIEGVNNQFGIYQVDNSDNNYFAGNVGIGDETPEEKLTVNGKTKASCIVLDGDGSSSIEICDAQDIVNLISGAQSSTFHWATGDFGACSWELHGLRERTVVCKNAGGQTVDESKCTTAKPATTIPCDICNDYASGTYLAGKPGRQKESANRGGIANLGDPSRELYFWGVNGLPEKGMVAGRTINYYHADDVANAVCKGAFGSSTALAKTGSDLYEHNNSNPGDNDQWYLADSSTTWKLDTSGRDKFIKGLDCYCP